MSSEAATKRPTGDEAIAILEKLQTSGEVSEASIQAHLKTIRGDIHRDTHARAEAAGRVREKRELNPEQITALIQTLKSRFNSVDKKLNKPLRSIKFADIEKSLRAAPEKLWSLQKLEETGGEPQVIGMEGDEFVFEDRCIESPWGRRDLNAAQAAAQAKEFGVDMQSEDDYKVMQRTGKFDLNTVSWLKTDPEYRERTGDALSGSRGGVGVNVGGNFAGNHNPFWGWRASLRVKKV